MFCSLHNLFKQATHRKMRSRAGLFAACWLLLNMQLAVAAHHEPPSAPVIPAAHAQLMDDMMQMPGMDNASQKILCDKHCHPDNAQPPASPELQLHALPAETSLLLVANTQESCIEPMAWQTPPVTGPPAEIRFCRFRE